MNTEDQRAYFALRERQEITAAATCEDDSAARAHFEMAALYRKRIEDLDRADA